MKTPCMFLQWEGLALISSEIMVDLSSLTIYLVNLWYLMHFEGKNVKKKKLNAYILQFNLCSRFCVSLQATL